MGKEVVGIACRVTCGTQTCTKENKVYAGEIPWNANGNNYNVEKVKAYIYSKTGVEDIQFSIAGDKSKATLIYDDTSGENKANMAALFGDMDAIAAASGLPAAPVTPSPSP